MNGRMRFRLALLALLLAAFALRLYRLDYQELRGDETFGYFFSLRPLAEMGPATLALHEPHPVASYYLQHFWLVQLGMDGQNPNEFALRFPSAWFGLLAVALLYALGRQVVHPNAALCAALLLVVSPYALWHSQDARMYSMSLALTTASTWLMVLWLQRQRRRYAVAYVVVTLLALHTHYFAFFVLVAQNLFVLLRLVGAPRLRITFLNWVVLQVTIAFFYGPWLWRVREILGSYGGNGDSPTLFAMLWRSLSVFVVGESAPANQRLWWAALAIVLVLWSATLLWCRGTNARRTLLLLTLYLVVPLLATWWGARTRPIFNERYLVAALPGFYLLLGSLVGQRQGARGVTSFQAYGFTRRPQHGAATGWLNNILVARAGNVNFGNWLSSYLPTLLVTFCLAGGLFSVQRYYTDPHYSKTRGWRALAATLHNWSAGLPVDEVHIAQNFPDPTLWYYYRGPVEHVVLPPQPHDAAGARAIVAELLDQGVQRVLLPEQAAPNWDEQGLAAGALARRYMPLVEQQVGVWPLRLYQRPFLTRTPITAPFQNGLQLTGFAHYPPQVFPGNVLIVALTWQGAITVPARDLKVFVQLLSAQGELLAQADRPFLADALSTHQPTYYDILLPTSIGPGPYRLIAGLYDGASEGLPRFLTTRGEDFVELTVLLAEGS